jgi:hypothetical protein
MSGGLGHMCKAGWLYENFPMSTVVKAMAALVAISVSGLFGLGCAAHWMIG